MTNTRESLLLVTGATGKVGRNFLAGFFEDERFHDFRVRALCHERRLEPRDRLEIVQGSIAERSVAREAMDGVTHVLHMATCKETPDDVMDVTVKGLFWLLEEARNSDRFERFLLVGGDAGIGHFFYPHPVPVTEDQGHSAYPGCYALSKVLEEVMLEQYSIQYDLDVTCLRAPWIMEKDDFRYTLSFGEDVFGGPVWRDLVGAERADEYFARSTVPVLCDNAGNAIDRNFVHVSDLVRAIEIALLHPAAGQELFHVCMNEPVNYRVVAEHLAQTRGLDSVDVLTEYSSTWLDNSKAKFLLRWKPEYDTKRLIDEAWAWERSADDPRRVWYPG